MSYPSPDTILLPTQLQGALYNQLVLFLSENETWLQLANFFGIFSDYDIQKMKMSNRPAEGFLAELGTRLCRVGTLCEALQQCQLFHILMLFKGPEPAYIIEEPHGTSDNNTCLIQRGRELRLTCKAMGLPPPTYQWYCNNEEITGETNSILLLKNFDIEHEGRYYCLVDQKEFRTISSNIVTVLLMPEPPVILRQPTPNEVCTIGSTISLFVFAKGHPRLCYQWFKENKQLDDCREPQLNIEIKGEEQEGHYRCYINNLAGETWSDTSRVTVYIPPHPEEPIASTKLALLIGNQLYKNVNPLFTPENDVKTLADLLRDYGFSVIALQNLNLREMRNAIQMFSKILPENAYVVFYFAGHGFQTQDKFMLPIDAPDPENYLETDALSERELLRNLLSSNPLLVVELLDMCLKPPTSVNKKIFEEKTNLYDYEPNTNLIQGYATTSYLGAYENKSDTNGLYVKHLKRYLTKGKDLPIVHVLESVNRDVSKDCPNQKPYFGSNATKHYKLTDYCEYNPAIKLKIESLSIVPKDTILKFKETGVELKVTCNPYLGVFLNTLEIHFSNVQDYYLGVEFVGSEISFDMKRFDKDVKAKVGNIQQLTSNKTLTWSLLKNGKTVDCAEWDLGKPMIAVADLWWTNDRRDAACDG